MTLKTPRRRISPQTRKRYRAIKDFLKRAIGTSSQPDIEINSGIAINVTDLKHSIAGLEKKLSEVNRTCRDFICLDGSRKSLSFVSTVLKDDTGREDPSQRVETEILYKTSGFIKSEDSDITPDNKKTNNDSQNKITDDFDLTKSKNKLNKRNNRVKDLDNNQEIHCHKIQLVGNIISTYSTCSFHTLTDQQELRRYNPDCSGDQFVERARKIDHKRKKYKEINQIIPNTLESHCKDKAVKYSKMKPKHVSNELDQYFIADIIKRQYKPVKMFGRRQSHISQFSEPVCCDREFSLNESMQEPELCSCCYGGHHSSKYCHQNYNSDGRNEYKVRHYNSKVKPRLKGHRIEADEYNDSELYDLIPVKEKSSPKSSRKFKGDILTTDRIFKEVPPSPRTNRPQFNLKVQSYTESDENINLFKNDNKKVSLKNDHKYHEPTENFRNDHEAQRHHHNKKLRPKKRQITNQEQISHETLTIDNLKYPKHFDLEQNDTTANSSLIKTQETESSLDKTDKTLSEIKDILQTFLQEIKKETSFSEKSDVSTKVTPSCVVNQNAQVNTSDMSNIGQSFNNYSSAPQCSSAPTPYVPHCPNTCCYPVLPIYPINYMQNGYLMANQSVACSCAIKTDNTIDSKSKENNNLSSETANETDELIKEIYKFIAESPRFPRKQDNNCDKQHNKNHFENINLTTRSVGGSRQIASHDAKVGTQQMKCFSKSCEAIRSEMTSDTNYSRTNATYTSESLEATATPTSYTELSTEYIEEQKKKTTKFGKVLRSFGLFKKTKKDTIEEVSENESTIDVEIKKPPFRRDVTNYMMHGEEYDNPPFPHNYEHYYPQDYRHPYNPAVQKYPSCPDDPYHNSRPYPPPPDYPIGHPSAPTYNYESYSQMHPQIPLCLKEIEVKSMATQSERKISFFRKIKQKFQPSLEQTRSDGARNFATQTKQNKPGLWENLQAKAMEGKNDPMAFSFSEQKKLAQGNSTMKNALLKKLFYKRNPFSPRNLMMNSLIGKDKAGASPFGAPPKAFRPRMFM